MEKKSYYSAELKRKAVNMKLAGIPKAENMKVLN